MSGQNGRVVVFAPSPQLTVTVEDLNGEPDIHVHPGGQGVWQARMITSLGVGVVLCGTVGGETGRVLQHLVDDPAIEAQLLHVDARNGAYVHDRRDGSRDELVEMPAGELSRHDLDDLYELTLTHALDAGIALLSGPSNDRVLPHSLYRRLTEDLSGNGCRVLADLAGQRLVEVLDGGPSFVKVSHEELIDDGRAASGDLDELIPAIREIAKCGPEAVVVSRAAEPALALVEDDLLTLHVPDLSPVDTRGGGDSMTAGVAACLAKGEPLREALRIGAAAGALNITRRGLGTGGGDAIRTLAERVELRPLRGNHS
ncbi:1-phosphofructokinase family hexose kinase [Allokutzneria sp. NRRL B-24872]|uniref:1-phosphofructokinase family hexose kinase n=1 Tax=Allokutzneria sp. NRRL B-24872 TaxID=1137961 RepID=UPI001AF000B9|nr:PfkB family carbohydrate kinase [Allokutzneria sp. NRRL B-24872]